MSAGSLPSPPPDAGLAVQHVTLLWSAGSGASMRASLVAAARRHAGRLRTMVDAPGILILGESGDPRGRVRASRDGSIAIIGSAFETAGEEQDARPAHLDTLRDCEDAGLFERAWGAFVLLRRRNGGVGVTWLRDPSGMAPLHLLKGTGFLVAAPALPRWLRDVAGIAPEIDMERLAATLGNPLLPTHRSLLKGVLSVPAGCAVDWDGERLGAVRRLWPSAALAADPVRRDPDEAAAALRTAVTRSCRALASAHGQVTVELSGGLDSAIVLGALASGRPAGTISCVHFAVAHAGADERIHARAVAERWRVRLVEVTARAAELSLPPLFAREQPVEPVLFGLDPTLERATIGVSEAFSSSAVFTGQGGDAVFFNFPAPEVAIDYRRAAGLSALFSKTAYDAAQRAHCSLWHVQRAMIRDWLVGSPHRDEQAVGLHLGTNGRALAPLGDARHPWLGGIERLSPARRLQLGAIANCQHFNGPTARADRFAFVHPLLAAPVVEACTRTPTFQLASGVRNRALARAAFADWLPDTILRRRGKGDASNYYRRVVVENRAFLREYLLDGMLVSQALLDRDGVEGALDEDSLIWSEQARIIVAYASLEAWARYWGAR